MRSRIEPLDNLRVRDHDDDDDDDGDDGDNDGDKNSGKGPDTGGPPLGPPAGPGPAPPTDGPAPPGSVVATPPLPPPPPPPPPPPSTATSPPATTAHQGTTFREGISILTPTPIPVTISTSSPSSSLALSSTAPPKLRTSMSSSIAFTDGATTTLLTSVPQTSVTATTSISATFSSVSAVPASTSTNDFGIGTPSGALTKPATDAIIATSVLVTALIGFVLSTFLWRRRRRRRRIASQLNDKPETPSLNESPPLAPGPPNTSPIMAINPAKPLPVPPPPTRSYVRSAALSSNPTPIYTLQRAPSGRIVSVRGGERSESLVSESSGKKKDGGLGIRYEGGRTPIMEEEEENEDWLNEIVDEVVRDSPPPPSVERELV